MIYEIIQHRVLVIEQHHVLLMLGCNMEHGAWNMEQLTTDQTD